MTKRITVSKVFEKNLKQLGLKEFPCGFGSWREDKNDKKYKTNFRKASKLSDSVIYEICAIKNVDNLLEHVRSPNSPWYSDFKWSNEATSLRETAICHPNLINEKFIFNFFKTLIFRNSLIQEIDPGVLNFTNLEELNLNINYISKISSENFPKGLKKLELSANKITDLRSLCVNPPPLVSLELGYNTIYNIDKYFTKHHWPHLLSFDLNHNNLCDLKKAVKACTYLHALQNLFLGGNPLSLVPGYRGYVISSLPHLVILDNIIITAEERFNFRELNMHEDRIENKATLIISIPSINGISFYTESLGGTVQSPVKRTYGVQIVILSEEEDRHANDSEYKKQELLDDVEHSLSFYQYMSRNNIPESMMDIRSAEERMQNEKVEVTSHNHSFLVTTDISPVKTTILSSDFLPIKENDIQINWECKMKYSNLLMFRDYLYRDIEVNVVESKQVPFSGDEESEDDKISKEKKMALRKIKLNKKVEKKLDKRESIEWSTPEYTSLAKFYVSVDSFITGNHYINNKLRQELIIDSDQFLNPTPLRNKLQRPRTPTSSANSTKKKRKSKENIEEDEEVLPSIDLSVSIKLHDWISTDQCLADQNE